MNILIAGCGELGQELGNNIQQRGGRITGIKRTPTPTSFPIIHLNLHEKPELLALPPEYDVIIFSATPSGRDEKSYQTVFDSILNNVIEYSKNHEKPPLFIFISSTGVYGQSNGEWVDEKSPTEPTNYSGKWILYGEQQVRKNLNNYVIVRFSGIYNDKRRWLINKAIKEEQFQKSPIQWTNRIHQSDCVGILQLLITTYEQHRPIQRCYLASDDNPAVRYNVLSFIAQKLNLEKKDSQDDECSNVVLNKRCSNKEIKKLGYNFIYPSYKEGYGEIVSNIIKKD